MGKYLFVYLDFKFNNWGREKISMIEKRLRSADLEQFSLNLLQFSFCDYSKKKISSFREWITLGSDKWFQ